MEVFIKIENIFLEGYKTRGVYSPAKKIDMGNCYMIYVSGVQAPKNENHRVITDDIEEQTKLVFEEIRKFKQLLDEGIISEDEFNTKKKQLLGL